MRLAEVVVPDPSGDATKACVAVFSSAGGTVEANIDRWAGQVRDASGKPATPSTRTRTVAGLKVTIVEMSGTYAGMGEGTPRPDWTLRGAIVEIGGGLLFIKMTGPAEGMKACAAAFDSMVDGMKAR